MLMIMGTSICHMLLGTEQQAGRRDVRGGGGRDSARASSATRRGSRARGTSSPGSCGPSRRQTGAATRMRRWSAKAAKLAAGRVGPARPGLVERQPLGVGGHAPVAGCCWGRHWTRRRSRSTERRSSPSPSAPATIIENFEQYGIAVNELYACGGMPEKNTLLMQIFADVTGRSIKLARSSQTSALGAAMFGAVVAGGEGRRVRKHLRCHRADGRA